MLTKEKHFKHIPNQHLQCEGELDDSQNSNTSP